MSEKFRIRAKRNDRVARWVITTGGMMIIFSVIFILLLIADTARPLFQPPQAEIFAKFPLPKEPTQQVLGLGIDEYLETAFFIDEEGVFNFFENQQGLPMDSYSAPPPKAGAFVLQVESFGRLQYGLLWDDGTLTIESVTFRTFFDELNNNKRAILHNVARAAEFPPTEFGLPLRSLGRLGNEGRQSRVDLFPQGRLLIQQKVVTESLFGDAEETLFSELIEVPA